MPPAKRTRKTAAAAENKAPPEANGNASPPPYKSPNFHASCSPVLHGTNVGCKRALEEFEMPPPATKMLAQPGIEDLLQAIDRPKGELVLADGSRWVGTPFGATKSISGEVVFNTAMVGYPESLTDPSYRGQLLVLTYPLVGNYGVPGEKKDDLGLSMFFESESIHISGLLVSEYSFDACHWNLMQSLSSWLQQHGIPALYGVDTRALTKRIREHGAVLGKIVMPGVDAASVPQVDPNKINLVAQVSIKAPKLYVSHAPARLSLSGKRMRIIAVDCGMKANIIRYFMSKGVELLVVPWDFDFSKEEYDGLFISNGPGDPTMCAPTIKFLKAALENRAVPIFGICLGNQLLALAAGCKTYKMKYGNRGANQPCIDTRTTRCYITAQNHGYAVDATSLPAGWEQFFVNANDGTNEGIIHKTRPFFSVQFHPEACAGPTDTDFLFEMFLHRVSGEHSPVTVAYSMTEQPMQKVLLLGSGGLSIGQAGEFDYSGSQAIKALKEMRCRTILVNPNIATVQTSAGMADRVYFLPVNADIVEQIIAKERPDGILLQFGGQTALNCGIALQKKGVLDKYNVRVLGTPVAAIEATEDRDIFMQKLREINEKIAVGYPAATIEEAVEAAAKIGYPVIMRAAFALGGLGSGFAHDEVSCRELAEKALACSSQVLVERSMKGWKEIEYEVVRDAADNCITVCNMENFDPLGIHTGDSIVVAPSQTLSNAEYMKLRSVAIKVARHLGIVGECNIQYALNPDSEEYCIIEVNARLSRSSALASKATGYPLAYVAAKLAMGEHLPHIRNSVTRTTTACFEPSLDYCVVKFPRWDSNKFSKVSAGLGSAMKSVGEVMAIGRNFQEAMQKAIRMATPGVVGFQPPKEDSIVDVFKTKEAIDEELANPSDRRIFALACAFARGDSVQSVYELTKINPWFLSKLQLIQKIRSKLHEYTPTSISTDLLRLSKQQGFSDQQISMALQCAESDVRALRLSRGIVPVVKQIDTLAAEFPAATNYLYMTYNGSESDGHAHEVEEKDMPGTLVLGCGAYRIGSSVEFDWCAVSCIRTLRAIGHRAIMVNYNPETVSTDYDECSTLYFEEISHERVLDIYQHENATGCIVSVGGQVPNNLALPLSASGVTILGTSPENVDRAEDRNKFSSILDRIGVDQPEWAELSTVELAKDFCRRVGYPCLIRPSYVLSGAAMKVVFSDADLQRFLIVACQVSPDHPVVISKFVEGAKEIEVDAVARDGQILNYAIAEHVENAGVHSGDATLILPAQKLFVETVRRVKKISRQIAKELRISGPFNIQLLAKDNDVKVIEANVRASRTFPFVSKTLKVDFIELATKVMVGAHVQPASISLLDVDYVGIKAPMFSFTRLVGADPVLGVEMASTGEVASFGEDKYDAILTSMISAGFKIPKRSVMLCLGPLAAKMEFMESARELLAMGLDLYCTEGTFDFYTDKGLPVKLLHKPLSKTQPNAEDFIGEGKIDLVINIRDSKASEESITNGYLIRRKAVDFSVCLLTDIKLATMLIESLARNKKPNIKAWDQYGA